KHSRTGPTALCLPNSAAHFPLSVFRTLMAFPGSAIPINVPSAERHNVVLGSQLHCTRSKSLPPLTAWAQMISSLCRSKHTEASQEKHMKLPVISSWQISLDLVRSQHRTNPLAEPPRAPSATVDGRQL